MAFHQSPDLHVLVGCNKYGYHVRIISQRVVSTASDNYAGFLVRKVFDRIKLRKEDLVVDRHIHICRVRISKGICIHYQGI